MRYRRHPHRVFYSFGILWLIGRAAGIAFIGAILVIIAAWALIAGNGPAVPGH